MGDMQPDEGFVFADEGSAAQPDIMFSFDEETAGGGAEAPKAQMSSGGGFPEITQLLDDKENPVFSDSAYYKNVFIGAPDSAKRLNMVFQKFMQTKDPSEKAVFRQQMTNVYWDFFSNVVKDCVSGLSEPKKNMIRFGMLHPGVISPESRSFFARVINDSGLKQPIYYLDEWFKIVGRGEVKASSTDEAKPAGGARGGESGHLKALLEKASGRFEGAEGLLLAKNTERLTLEENLTAKVAALTSHGPAAQFERVKECYSEGQKASFNEMSEIMKQLHRLDREMSKLLSEYAQCKTDVATIKEKLDSASEGEGGSFDMQAIDTEYQSMRQMAKMTIGRQGNPFPVLTNDYFHSLADNVGFRENIIRKLAWVEEADCEAFTRVYKNHPSRIVPYILLLPTYGDFGICWEPFDKANKATSRGRVAIPMYPKNLTIAILTAMGDFRWQVAKEIASMYWMEEGLTGNYFQWFQAQKLKGDVKMYFIQDYILWMTKEREGVQKLDKNVRGIFWRFMPFSQPLKEKLKDRNLIYQELYQRDKNRAQSDGY
ncbi:MAG: hypothetical protein LBC77_06490 [Spirochaetaceae bacterium]|jgi:chorismate mutase|nr:hypothetical protein [Spirochaetaceae bacterium]